MFMHLYFYVQNCIMKLISKYDGELQMNILNREN